MSILMATVKTSKLAAELKISRQRVYQLAADGKITREADGNWNVGKVRAALGRNLDTRQASAVRGEERPASAPRMQMSETPTRGSMAHAQLMHEQAKAARSALEAQRLEGKLIDRKAVDAAWADVCARLRDGVMGLPVRVCNRCPAEWRRELAPVLADEARKTLTEISNELRASTAVN
jgi:hypothetical protein